MNWQGLEGSFPAEQPGGWNGSDGAFGDSEEASAAGEDAQGWGRG